MFPKKIKENKFLTPVIIINNFIIPWRFVLTEIKTSTREANIWPFLPFLSLVENGFLAHCYLHFIGHCEVSSGRFWDFFSGCILFFSGRNSLILRYFFMTGKYKDFFPRAKNFFKGKICCFFSGRTCFLCSRAVFKISPREVSICF